MHSMLSKEERPSQQATGHESAVHVSFTLGNNSGSSPIIFSMLAKLLLDATQNKHDTGLKVSLGYRFPQEAPASPRSRGWLSEQGLRATTFKVA